jgi:peptidoglycan-N-acetylglucosamine deacetylase
MKKILILSFFLIAAISARSQNAQVWNNKQCTVVLTYDDALDVHLDNVIPLLDSLNFKGTFYLMGTSNVLDARMNEWRKAAQNGHELGNHTLYHPCDGSRSGRSFVNPETDLSKFSVSRAIEDILVTNTLLKAIDGKDTRSFAYPCGDLKIGDSLFYKSISKKFTGARGVMSGMKTIDKVDIDNINCYMINNHSAEYMINLVKQASQTHTLLVFLFHGVGGGHNINVQLSEHSKLLHYLKENEKDIWVAPMTEVAQHIRNYQDKMMSLK